MTVSGGLVPKGHVLKNFWFRDLHGKKRAFSELQGRWSFIVAVLVHSKTEWERFVSQLEPLSDSLKELEAKILLLTVAGSRGAGLASQLQTKLSPGLQAQLIVGVVDDARTLADLGATQANSSSSSVLYVTDPWGEVYAGWRITGPKSMPGGPELLQWVRFVSYQCPECFPPEWPI